MNGNRFFSVPYDLCSDVKMQWLMRRCGGIAAVGRWVVLLGMLYDQDGLLDMNDQTMREIVSESLELEDVDEFMTRLAEVGLIEKDIYDATSHVVNHGVCDELEYRKTKSEAGKKGSSKRWKNANGTS